MRETPEAALAFEQYYDLGEDRSLFLLAQKRLQEIIAKNQNTTKRLPTEATLLANLKKWSVEHKWQERVIAKDRLTAEKERKKSDKAIKAMNERHALIGTTQQARAIKQIEALIDAKSFGSMAAVQLLKMATDLERVARGAPTEHTEHTGTIEFSDARMTLEERLDAMQATMQAKKAAAELAGGDGGDAPHE